MLTKLTFDSFWIVPLICNLHTGTPEQIFAKPDLENLYGFGELRPDHSQADLAFSSIPEMRMVPFRANLFLIFELNIYIFSNFIL